MECGVDDPKMWHTLAKTLGQDNMKTIHQFLSITVAQMSTDSTCPQSQQKRLGADRLHHEATGNGSHPGMPNSMLSNMTGADYNVIQVYGELVESQTSCFAGGQRCNANGAISSSANSRTLDMTLEHQSETTYHQDMTVLLFQNFSADWAVGALKHDVEDLLCDPNNFCGIPTSGNEVNPCKGKDHVPEVREFHSWELLPDDIQGLVLKKLKFEHLFQAKLVSRGMKNVIESPAFVSSREQGPCPVLACLHFHVKDGPLQWSGFDLVLNEWRPLPTLRCLPPPDMDLFKDYLVSASSGLLCANVSKSLHNEEELVVCNPMTQSRRILPPLNFRRNPVLMHLLTDPKNNNSYKVIVAGSSGMVMTTEGHNANLSRKTEVFDSLTSQWQVTGDMPGLEFGLNEYQTGVCTNGILYCISYLADGSGKGVVAYDVAAGAWLSDWRCPLPSPGIDNSQMVECDGEVYLFSEHATGRAVEHRIYKLENAAGDSMSRWKTVVREKKTGGRGLLVYPQYACVGFGAGKLCIFDTIEHTGKVHDIRNGGHFELPPSPVMRSSSKGGEQLFHSLNPLSFTFTPDFHAKVGT